ncbi:Fusaridione A cluster transcription factor fsdR [Fusarium oxysporum f. sp. rapae]|uniref:Fusaridione A cluster transcription factor fsdR n=1 Tax=Fusarium oxysporum f. sp. rapae TaxID=485398 RepID=A0A8J5NLE2_FUSOX|nr:Fusaridione A cluster transcription factor fsdR [Fusarium oxysporum f. sp. rapae]
MQSEEDAGQGRGKKQYRAQIFDHLNDFGSKQYIHMLEERLTKLESSLEKSASAQPSQEWTAISRPPDVESRGHVDETGKHFASLSGGISTGPQVEPSTILGASSSIVSTESTQPTSQAVLEKLEAPTGILESLDITNDIEFHVSYTEESQRPSVSPPKLPGSQSDVNLFRSQLDPSGFRRQVFASVQSQFLLRHLITSALDNINDFYPVFTVESLSELLQQQFLAGPRNCDDSPSRWATTNALIAIAIQWKIEHGAHDQLLPIAWGYFKNAFAIFPELLIRGNDISTCQALLFMAVFMHGTADARASSSITASLTRALQAVGLHTRRWYEKLDRTTVEQHMRVLWIAYCIDSDQMMKQGLPSTFGNEIDLELPVNGPPDGLSDYTLPGTQEKINVLRCMAGLAMIQSRISTELYSQRALKMNSTQLHRAVEELNHQLDMWKMDLPPDIRPTYDSYPSNSQLEMPVLLLTIIYYTTAGRINMATKRLGHSNDDTVRLLAQVPITAARATLRLIQKMSPPPFSLSW